MTIDYRLGPEQVFSGLLSVQYSLSCEGQQHIIGALLQTVLDVILNCLF